MYAYRVTAERLKWELMRSFSEDLHIIASIILVKSISTYDCHVVAVARRSWLSSRGSSVACISKAPTNGCPGRGVCARKLTQMVACDAVPGGSTLSQNLFSSQYVQPFLAATAAVAGVPTGNASIGNITVGDTTSGRRRSLLGLLREPEFELSYDSRYRILENSGMRLCIQIHSACSHCIQQCRCIQDSLHSLDIS